MALLPTAASSAETMSLAREESVLAEIQRTGILKGAIRRNAAPIGYLNQAGEVDTVWNHGFGEAVPYVVDLFNECSN